MYVNSFVIFIVGILVVLHLIGVIFCCFLFLHGLFLLLFRLFIFESFFVLDHIVFCQPCVLVEPELLHGLNDIVTLDRASLAVLANLSCFTGDEEKELGDTFLHCFLCLFGNLARPSIVYVVVHVV